MFPVQTRWIEKLFWQIQSCCDCSDFTTGPPERNLNMKLRNAIVHFPTTNWQKKSHFYWVREPVSNVVNSLMEPLIIQDDSVTKLDNCCPVIETVSSSGTRGFCHTGRRPKNSDMLVLASLAYVCHFRQSSGWYGVVWTCHEELYCENYTKTLIKY